jgi:3-oxoacyl-[acyl-carrier-protein] synthase II
MAERVVVTGLGIVSPIGNDIPTFEANLKKGVVGEGPITHFPSENFPVKRAFESKNFTAPPSTKQLDPFIQFAVSSTDQALRDSGLDLTEWDPYDIGIVMSSSKGGLTTYCRQIEKFKKNNRALLAARIYSSFIPNIASQWIARKRKIRGPAVCYVTACATGTYSISEAAEMIRRDEVKICIAGASDASICELPLAGYYKMGVYAKGPMLPFGKKRTGFQVGEGAGCLILEPLEQAKKRGAKIYGEIGAHANQADPYHVIGFNPKGDALKRTIEITLKREGLRSEDLSYINLHGTATPGGDTYEADQLRSTFGRLVSRIPMSATKSMTGHMLGASGTVEIIATLLGIRGEYLPPTGGVEEVDESFKDLDLVPNTSRKARVQTALTYSMGFGGSLAALILKQFQS